jgi:hypothetical protein
MVRRQPQLSVTLFPFLAVLVCAMGSLILLLLVMTRKIREDQRTETAPPKPSAVPSAPAFNDRSTELLTLERENRELDRIAGGLRQSVERLRQELTAAQAVVTERRGRLNALQAAIASQPQPEVPTENVAATVESLRAEEQRLTADLSAAEAALLDKRDELARAEDDLREAELALFEKSSALVALRQRAARAETAAAKSSGTETLLEFTNSTGTSRIPIVIDVSKTGYEFLPCGLRITAADMEQFPVRDNPLLSAVYAVHRHRSGSQVTAEPYVLLLVRPGGSLPFYGAQRILQEARIHYGYELLQPATFVTVGEPDPAEGPVIERALTEVFRRRATLYSRLYEVAQEERQRLEAAAVSRRGQSAAEGSGPEDETEADDRRLAVRPDGRVVEEAGPPRRRLEGRFYAGGVAPPSNFFENRAASAAAGAPRGRLNAAQAEQMAEEFAAAYARQRALAEASQSAAAEAAAAAPSGSNPRNAAANNAPQPLNADTLRSPTEERFADSLFGGDGSLQGSRLVGPRSDAFGGLPATADIKPAPSSPATGDSVPRVPWQHLAQSANQAGSAQENGNRSQGASGFGSDGPSKLDRETLRLMDAPARRSSSLKSPVGIVVFIDERHLAVAQQPAVELQPDQPAVAEEALFRGINNELLDARHSPRESLLPVVRFVVSPGGERWRMPLAKSLKQAGIASVTQYELTPYMLPGTTSGYATLDEVSAEATP